MERSGVRVHLSRPGHFAPREQLRAERSNPLNVDCSTSPSLLELHLTSRHGERGDMDLDDVTGAIVDASIRIHDKLGPGVLESVYEIVLAAILERRGLRVVRQQPVTFSFEGIVFENGFRADLVVENCVIVEVKSLERLDRVHPKQLLTYLRLMNLQVGLLLNFNTALMKDGITRVVNGLPPSASPHLRVNN